MLTTTFDSPQFPLLPDPEGFRNYGNVSNCLEVELPSGHYKLAVAVPTGLFPLLKDVFDIPVDATVTLSIDYLSAGEDKKYVFSFMAGEDHLIDLWYYSEAGLPEWIKRAGVRS